MKEIPLTKGVVALVDDFDYEELSRFKWCVTNNYASRRLRLAEDPLRRMTYMHTQITGILFVDHEDGNKVNNQRSNLRPATTKQNSRSFRRKSEGTSSQFRGVCFDRSRDKWLASIEVDGKQIYLGRFEDEKDAAGAYDVAAVRFFGGFASKNIL